MKKAMIAAAVIAGIGAASTALMAEDEAAKAPEREKCYGVAKAGKNDCAAKDGSNSCAGQTTKDHDPNNWVFVPKGLCDKLAGGTLHE